MNKVILIGRLSRDPELRYTQSNKAIVRFTVACNRGKDHAGNDLGTDFINCYALGNLAENVNKYTKKGSQLAVGGSIRFTTYDGDDGKKRYKTEVQATEVTFCGTKSKNDVPYVEPTDTNTQNTSEETIEDPFANFGEEIVITDDDLPF